VASVLELELELLAVDAGAAFGAALLGGVAAGVYASPAEAVAAAVRTTSRVEPVESWVKTYRELQPQFEAMYPALRTVRSAR
jgi:xylulokinase